MSLTLRILCIVGSALVFVFIANSIKKKRVQLEDAIFWVFLSLALLIVAIFPQLAIFLSDLIGIKAPSNFVFLVAIAILLIRLFSLSTEVSRLKHRLNELAQEEALLAKQEEDNRGKE